MDAARTDRMTGSSGGDAHDPRASLGLPDEGTPLTTRTDVRQVAGGSAVVVTMSRADGKPATLGPLGLAALGVAVSDAVEKVQGEGHAGVVLTGTGATFLAGADLDLVAAHGHDGEAVRELGRAGHDLISAILDSPVPIVALINGTALGGGLEVALACRARVAAEDVRALGLPEAYLGLIPGWGGSFLLPHLIGPASAIKVMIENPLRNNTTLRAVEAFELGLVDRVVPGVRDDDGELGWPGDTLGVLLGDLPRDAAPERSTVAESEWEEALERSRDKVERAERGGRPAPRRTLELIAGARTAGRGAAFAAEEDAIAELVPLPPLHDTIHAMGLLRRFRPRRVRSEVRSLGVIGGGLMASQLATLLAARLRIPVALREIDDERAARTEKLLDAEIEKLGPRADVEALRGRLSVGTDLALLADADLVIEAVFEELEVKRAVFAEIEPLLREDAILATNTSGLSITRMGEALARPERLVGIHFFNPVAQMPLVEIVRTEATVPEVVDAARTLAQAAGKTTVDVLDAPGFIVNRVLLRMLAITMESLERGTPPEVVGHSLEPIGLPMGPLHLLQLVGPAVANHVLHTLNSELGPRFPLSPGLESIIAEGVSFLDGPPAAATPINADIVRFFEPSSPEPDDAAAVLRRVQLGLADEIHRMLDQGVAERDAIDLALITGAGFPLHRGGITRYLDEVGAAEETGGAFHRRRGQG